MASEHVPDALGAGCPYTTSGSSTSSADLTVSVQRWRSVFDARPTMKFQVDIGIRTRVMPGVRSLVAVIRR
ncbi:MAG: hypothetical protein JO280_14975 [Mycobacteriaceae bacterium]|nr:hypothetical protein [Mycobacteriaceae bacterium]